MYNGHIKDRIRRRSYIIIAQIILSGVCGAHVLLASVKREKKRERVKQIQRNLDKGR